MRWEDWSPAGSHASSASGGRASRSRARRHPERTALDIAVRLLRQGELDQAIVGAVDLAGDVRAVLATHRLQPFSSSGTVRPLDAQADGTIPGDGAAALVLKRLDDAVRDGDRIYAVVLGIGVASGPDPSAYLAALRRGYAEAAVAPASVGYLEAHGSGRPDEDRREAAALAEFAANGLSPRARWGRRRPTSATPGAAAALAGLVKAVLCLHQQILPPLRGVATLRPELAAGADSSPAPYFLPRGPQFWLRDRAEGPRRAAVSAQGIDGNVIHVVLEEFEPAAAITSDERRQPLGTRPAALFAVEGDDPAALAARDRCPGPARRGLAHRPHRGAGPALVARSSQRPRPAARSGGGGRQRPDAPRPAGRGAVAAPGSRRRDPCHPAGMGWGLSDPAFFLTPRERAPLGQMQGQGGVAFVFPGIGNQFAGMGRALSALWPEILRAQDAGEPVPPRQLAPGTFWNDDPPERFVDQRAPILGQVALGTIVSDC